jgi:hypothetical protein
MLDLCRILLGHLLARLPGHLTGDLEKILLAVVQALSCGCGSPLDGAAPCHVVLGLGDGSGLGLGDGEALG